MSPRRTLACCLAVLGLAGGLAGCLSSAESAAREGAEAGAAPLAAAAQPRPDIFEAPEVRPPVVVAEGAARVGEPLALRIEAPDAALVDVLWTLTTPAGVQVLAAGRAVHVVPDAPGVLLAQVQARDVYDRPVQVEMAFVVDEPA